VASVAADSPVMVDPDLDFIQALREQGGHTFKKCMQCGTCSATCAMSPDPEPFPRKEMAWASWGMKDRLLQDPDVWLCHQCNDCQTMCPRDARPGDILAAIRRESVIYHTVPHFMAKAINHKKFIPLIFIGPALLLWLALVLRDPIARALNIPVQTGEPIVYSYSAHFPHWLLNGFFLFFSLLAVIVSINGVRRFWSTLKAAGTAEHRQERERRGIAASIWSVAKSIARGDNFAQCTTKHNRLLSHSCVLFGFVALCVVTAWVITGPINPLIRGEFFYPFGFFSPWKLLANIGGLALLFGTFLMIFDRLMDSERGAVNYYWDWVFLLVLFAVVVTGFATELLHYLRLEPHRHVVYFIHLVSAFVLLMNLPFSKFAHVLYRATAMVYAEYTGRNQQLGRADEAAQEEEGK